MAFARSVLRDFFFIEDKGFDAEAVLDFWIEKAPYFNKEIC